MIYLDHNATTRPAPEVIDVMGASLREGWANPSSIHRPGQAVRQKIELARHELCTVVNCRDRELIITAGGTESVNLAVRGTLEAMPERATLVTSRLEHSAVQGTAELLARRGVEVIWLPNDRRGLVDLDALAQVLDERATDIALVSIMMVNNETGVVQPIEDIAAMCSNRQVRFHTDATQAIGRIPFDFSAESMQGVDLVSFSAHKFHGPKGVGGLIVREGRRLAAQITGGPQERERRAGTENVPGILGMGEAARLARVWLTDSQRHVMDRLALRDRLEASVRDMMPGVVANGGDAPRAWTTANLAFPGLEAESILMMLSERGLCASAGAACSSGSIEPSPVLKAMDLPASHASGSIRFSLARDTMRDEIDRAIELIGGVIEQLLQTVSA